MNIIERFNAFAALGATWVLWALVGLSVIGVTITFERILCFVTTRDDLEALRGDLLELLARGELSKARNRLQESPSFEARIAAVGLSTDDAGVEDRIAAETTRVRVDMERHLAFLGTVGSNAPFVGLFGTVIGVIGAFRELDRSGGQLSAGLMGAIAEALVATAVGILVALPAVAAYNALSRVIQARLARAEALGKDVLAALKSARYGVR